MTASDSRRRAALTAGAALALLLLAPLTASAHVPDASDVAQSRDGLRLGARRARATLTLAGRGAHLSAAGLVDAAGFAGTAPRTFSEPGFAESQLLVDGRQVPFAPEAAATALAGRWRWIVTARWISGASAPRVSGGTRFMLRSIGSQSTGIGAGWSDR